MGRALCVIQSSFGEVGAESSARKATNSQLLQPKAWIRYQIRFICSAGPCGGGGADSAEFPPRRTASRSRSASHQLRRLGQLLRASIFSKLTMTSYPARGRMGRPALATPPLCYRRNSAVAKHKLLNITLNLKRRIRRSRGKKGRTKIWGGEATLAYQEGIPLELTACRKTASSSGAASADKGRGLSRSRTPRRSRSRDKRRPRRRTHPTAMEKIKRQRRR